MKKALMICGFVFLLSGFVLSQTVEDSDSGYYSAEMLKSDFKQVKAVVYVDVRHVKLSDKLAEECEKKNSVGYCLYEMIGEVKEIFKGMDKDKRIKFYAITDAGYPMKQLMGERVVFLNRYEHTITKRLEFFQLENSTRSIEHDVLTKLRMVRKQLSKKSTKTAKP
jgi:hypothetical protein